MEPDFIFEVEYSDTNAHNAKFNELSQSREVWYAYHGSRVDNFHSILHNGLHAHLNKVLVVVEFFVNIAQGFCKHSQFDDWLTPRESLTMISFSIKMEIALM